MGLTRMVDIDTHLGRRLRLRRRLLGLTQQELADACGVRFQQIQKYECAANRMTAARLWEIAVALGVQPAYFFDGLGAQMEPRSFIRHMGAALQDAQ
jgi:transcriptional regulator with XRE-family HTH domain